MFFKPAAFFLAALVTFVAAAPSSDYYGSCNTGNIKCCNEVHDVHSEAAKHELSLLSMSADGLTGVIGTQCSPLTVGGIGAGNKW
ncbi:hypothetical protein AX16_010717 [Volvariella volvacea WC 439]|nr:hypothetical protein AX16_010717 [Volvariella volvacea WC 439]